MKKLYTYGLYCISALSFCYGIMSVCYAVMYVRHIYGIRIIHALMIRNKMHENTQKIYQQIPHMYMNELVCAQGNEQELCDDNTVWFVINAEQYGPIKQQPKRRRKATTSTYTHKKQHASIVTDHKDLLTHRTVLFAMPLPPESYWLSSRFGPRLKSDGSAGFHKGIDLAANRGTPVYASRSGIVEYAGSNGGYGKMVVLRHNAYFKTRYAHLDKIFVKIGDTVTRGATLGAVGATGHVRKKGGDGSHLHFEVQYKGKRVDPLQFLPDIVS